MSDRSFARSPAAASASIGGRMTSVTATSVTPISENPTSDTPLYDGNSSKLVSATAMRSVLVRRLGKVTVCPAAVRDASVRSRSTPWPASLVSPPNRNRARVIQRLLEARRVCTKCTVDTSTGSGQVIWM